MHRIVVACAAFMVFASPLRAQTTPDEPSASSAPALPPSFVPPPPAKLYGNMPRPHHRATTRQPSAKPRHTATRHAAKRHEKANGKETTKRHETAKRHGVTKHQRGTKHEHATHEQRAATHLSKRTIRQCHAMSYRQIMRNSNCRSLMKQELAASERRTSHASRHHKSSKNSGSSHRKAATRKHGHMHHRR